MRVVLSSGYSTRDGDIFYVRDGAFATAADEDPILLWDNYDNFENGEQETLIFDKRHLTPLEEPRAYDDDITEEEFDKRLDAGTPVDITVNKDNETVTYQTGDIVDVTLRGKVWTAGEGAISFKYEGHDAFVIYYTDENLRDIKLVHRKVSHPAPGSIVEIEVDDGWYEGAFILGDNGVYYGIDDDSRGTTIVKNDPTIKQIINKVIF